jgi:hypothetical protein
MDELITKEFLLSSKYIAEPTCFLELTTFVGCTILNDPKNYFPSLMLTTI